MVLDPHALDQWVPTVGLGTMGTQDDLADIAIAELRTIGGFERSAIAVAGTTGTGWIDPRTAAALESVGGDVATVATQYSFSRTGRR